MELLLGVWVVGFALSNILGGIWLFDEYGPGIMFDPRAWLALGVLSTLWFYTILGWVVMKLIKRRFDDNLVDG